MTRGQTAPIRGIIRDAPSLRVHAPARRPALVTARHRHPPPRQGILRGRRPRATPIPGHPPCRTVRTGVPDYPPCPAGRRARRPTTGCLLHRAEAGVVAGSTASAALASGPRSRRGPSAMACSRSRRLSRRRRPSRPWTMRMPGTPFRSFICMLNIFLRARDSSGIFLVANHGTRACSLFLPPAAPRGRALVREWRIEVSWGRFPRLSGLSFSSVCQP